MSNSKTTEPTREERLEAALLRCFVFLTSPELSKWKYVESGHLHADAHRLAETAKEALL